MNQNTSLSPALPTRRTLLQRALALGAAAALPVRAQGTYPTRPVTLIVAYPPGGPNDITARVVTQPVAGYWGQPVVVDNRAGAGGAIGAQAAARSAPDGYTLFLAAINHVILQSLKTDLPYDLERDFIPVCLFATYPQILVVNPTLEVKSVAELIAYAKANPGKLTYASSGPGGGEHLAGELFCAQAGVKMLHVPYKGSAPGMTDLLGGQVQLMFSTAPTSVPHIKSGKLRALGISSKQRSAVMPELPTIAESGLPGYESNSWNGVLAPTGTPPAVITRINAMLVRALAEPAVKAKVLELSGEVAPGTPADFQQFIRAESVKWAGIVKQANIKLD